MDLFEQAGIVTSKDDHISQFYQNYRDARKNEDSLAEAIEKLNIVIRSFSNWTLKHVPNSDKTINKLKDIRTDLNIELFKYHDQSEDAFIKYKDAFTTQNIHDNVNNLIDDATKDSLDDHKVAVLKPGSAVNDPKLSK